MVRMYFVSVICLYGYVLVFSIFICFGCFVLGEAGRPSPF